MKSYAIQLTVEAPLSIRADHSPESAGAAGYIPGQTLVGGLAAVHRLLHKDEKTEFEQMFLGEQVHYANLYPAVFHDKEASGPSAASNDRDMRDSKLPVYPLPRTAQSCKRHPGFRFPKHEENDAHGVRDSLIDWAVFKLGEGRRDVDPLAALLKHEICSYVECSGRERMNRFDGYYRRSARDQNEMMHARVSEYMRLQTHTGIDRASGTVQEGILYNRMVFEEGMRFWGSVQFPDDNGLVQAFERFMQEVGSSGLVRIGTGRTRGMGRVRIDHIPETPRSYESFKQRLKGFDKLLHQEARHFELGPLQDRHFFALTLHSPLILTDEFLRYRGTIDEQVVGELLGYAVPGLKRVYQSASVRRVTGWQELWGLPRMNEYAIDSGSVFLFECASPLDSDQELLQALFRLEEHGAGKRRREGFGRVCVSDQFHQEIVLK